MEEEISLLRGLDGILEVSTISDYMFPGLTYLEEQYGTNLQIPVINLGMSQVLKRDIVYAVLKDLSFRKPLQPTVYLVEEVSGDCSKEETFVRIDEKCYRILGEEVLDENANYEEDHISISETFVHFPKRRTNSSIPSYFILPPIGFPELEQKKDEFGIDDIVSASPNPHSDQFIRDMGNFSRNSDYGTILIGFNLSF